MARERGSRPGRPQQPLRVSPGPAVGLSDPRRSFRPPTNKRRCGDLFHLPLPRPELVPQPSPPLFPEPPSPERTPRLLFLRLCLALTRVATTVREAAERLEKHPERLSRRRDDPSLLRRGEREPKNNRRARGRGLCGGLRNSGG